MEQASRNRIKKLTLAQIDISSANKYSTKVGISSATISNLVNDKWDLISDEMWQKLGVACGFKELPWNVVETTNFNLITSILNESKTFSEAFGFVSPQGSSKTEACKNFYQSYPDVIMLECEEHWGKKEFLTKLYQGMGHAAYGLSTSGLMEAIQLAAVKSTTPPIIIMDELDKVRDELLYFFISLYNRLHGKCGLFVCATPYLEKRIEQGLKAGRKGYAEFYSRIGGKFVHGKPANSMDITKICRANGIQDDKMIEDIIKDCGMDLRRVERLINAKKRRIKKEMTAQPKREGVEL